jgi:molybdopterin-guanine dinucleotide biosynthesis protein A
MYEGLPLSVAILAGGRSRRMGQDKALLTVGGRTLLEHVVERVAPVATEVFVVATGRPEYRRFGLPVVDDLLPERGSLGGIYTALLTARNEHCLVVACDMPLLSSPLLSFLASLERDYDALVPRIAGGRGGQRGAATLETLHAIYARRAAPVLERRLRSGQLKVADALDGLRLRTVDETELRRYDPELRSFRNVNTPSDLDRLDQLLAAERRNEGGL